MRKKEGVSQQSGMQDAVEEISDFEEFDESLFDGLDSTSE